MKIKRIIIILLSIITIILLYNNILFPAHLSTLKACNTEKFTNNYGDQYFSAGSFTVNVSFDKNINKTKTETNINIAEGFEENIPVLKHELCHQRQFLQKRLFSCNQPFFRLINEIECYSIERFWEIYL